MRQPEEKSLEGWKSQELLGEHPECDAWIRHAPAGTSIRPHRHPNNRLFVSLLSGKMQLTVGEEEHFLSDEDGEVKTIYVPAGKTVSGEVIEEVSVVNIFQPPMGREPHPRG